MSVNFNNLSRKNIKKVTENPKNTSDDSEINTKKEHNEKINSTKSKPNIDKNKKITNISEIFPALIRSKSQDYQESSETSKSDDEFLFIDERIVSSSTVFSSNSKYTEDFPIPTTTPKKENKTNNRVQNRISPKRRNETKKKSQQSDDEYDDDSERSNESISSFHSKIRARIFSSPGKIRISPSHSSVEIIGRKTDEYSEEDFVDMDDICDDKKAELEKKEVEKKPKNEMFARFLKKPQKKAEIQIKKDVNIELKKKSKSFKRSDSLGSNSSWSSVVKTTKIYPYKRTQKEDTNMLILGVQKTIEHSFYSKFEEEYSSEKTDSIEDEKHSDITSTTSNDLNLVKKNKSVSFDYEETEENTPKLLIQTKDMFSRFKKKSNQKRIIDTTNEDKVKDFKIKFTDKMKRLPIFKHLTDIELRLNNLLQDEKESICIIAPTGSGKTTVCSVIISNSYEKRKLKKPLRVIVCSPRRAAVASAKEFLLSNLIFPNLEEDNFGTAYDNEINYNVDKTRIVFATTQHVQNLMQKYIQNEKKFPFDVIIIDEFHLGEMSSDIVATMWYYQKELLKCNIVFMSATPDMSILEKYDFIHTDLDEESNNLRKIFNNKVLLYNTDSYKVDVVKLIPENELHVNILDKEKETLKYFINSLLEITNKTEINEHILIFVDGKVLMDIIYDQIKEYEQNLGDHKIYKMHSEMDMSEIMNALNDNDAYRKIIIATNIAETSITIDALYHVYDFGIEKISNSSISGGIILERKFISKSSVKQRMGRTGRTNNGTYYSLYSNYDYEFSMPEIREREILRLQITTILLHFIGSGISYKILEFWRSSKDVLISLLDLAKIQLCKLEITNIEQLKLEDEYFYNGLIDRYIVNKNNVRIYVEKTPFTDLASKLTFDYKCSRAFTEMCFDDDIKDAEVFSVLFVLSILQITWDRLLKIPDYKKENDFSKSKKEHKNSFKKEYYGEYFENASCSVEGYLNFYNKIVSTINIFESNALKNFCYTNMFRYNSFKDLITHMRTSFSIYKKWSLKRKFDSKIPDMIDTMDKHNEDDYFDMNQIIDLFECDVDISLVLKKLRKYFLTAFDLSTILHDTTINNINGKFIEDVDIFSPKLQGEFDKILMGSFLGRFYCVITDKITKCNQRFYVNPNEMETNYREALNRNCIILGNFTHINRTYITSFINWTNDEELKKDYEAYMDYKNNNNTIELIILPLEIRTKTGSTRWCDIAEEEDEELSNSQNLLSGPPTRSSSFGIIRDSEIEKKILLNIEGLLDDNEIVDWSNNYSEEESEEDDDSDDSI